MTAFEELGVLPEIGKALDELEWTLPTDIQSEAIPAILGGGDACMAAETGSGKTGAFCIPILQIVYESMQPKISKKHDVQETQDQWRMSIHDRDHNLGVDQSGLVCESNHPKLWSGVRATKGVKNSGTDDQGFGFGGTGKKSNSGKFDDYGESFTLNDVIGCFIDLEVGRIHWSKNGKEFPYAYTLRGNFVNAGLCPAVVIKNARLRLNFGQSPFRFAPKEDFVPLCRAVPACQVISPKEIKKDDCSEDIEKRNLNQPLCLIVEPTKELAQQTSTQIGILMKYLNNPKIKNVPAVSGIHMGEQLALINSGCDILTGTPGRIRSLVQERHIDLSHIRFFVLDEADSLLGGQNDSANIIFELHNQIPKYGLSGTRLQMIVCSATLHNMAVQKLATQYMYFPQWIDLKGQDSVPETVHQVVCLIDPKEDKSWIRLRSQPNNSIKTDGIHSNDQIRPGTDIPETLSEGVKILKAEYVLHAINAHKMDQCIIFCRTKLDCDNLERFLTSKSHPCVCLHSDRSSDERTRNLKLFKEKKSKFLICTDVAARGLDVSGIPYVINVTLPPTEEKANYVHRIGRVGRAERMGLAISLVSVVPEKVWYHQCKSRGANCLNTRLVTQGGCAKWYDEISYLGEIEEHLGVTINRVGSDMAVPVDEYDGKVVYGAKKSNEGGPNYGHAVELKGILGELGNLEREVQW
ncbi:hypothetical protein Mgra_00005499, partial [Meloidogyne graminicola]